MKIIFFSLFHILFDQDGQTLLAVLPVCFEFVLLLLNSHFLFLVPPILLLPLTLPNFHFLLLHHFPVCLGFLVLSYHACTFPHKHVICFLIITLQDGLAAHTTPASTSPYQPAVLQPSTEPSPQVSQSYWICLCLPNPPLICCSWKILCLSRLRDNVSLASVPVYVYHILYCSFENAKQDEPTTGCSSEHRENRKSKES